MKAGSISKPGSILALLTIVTLVAAIFPVPAGAAVDPQCNGIQGKPPNSMSVTATDVNGGDLLSGDVVSVTVTWPSTQESGGTVLYCLHGGGPGNNYIYSNKTSPPPASGTWTFTWTFGTDVTANPGAQLCSKGFLTGTQNPGGGTGAGQKGSGNCLTVGTPPRPDMTVSKSGPATAETGAAVSYTVTATNNSGAAAATNVVVTDNLPSGTAYVSSSRSDAGTCSHASGVVTCNLGTVAASGSVQITINITAPATVPGSGKITNNVSVASDDDSNTNNNTASHDTTITDASRPDMSVSKSGPATAQTGAAVSYTVTATNNSAAAGATNVVVTDNLPSGTTFVSASSGSGSCSHAGGVVTCNLGTVAASGSVQITINITAPATVPGSGKITNNVSIASDDDANNANNSDSHDTTITTDAPPASADLVMVKSDADDPVQAGNNISYTLSVTNNGPDSALSVVVSDTLPTGLGFVSATSSQGTCNTASPISCSLGTLANGQTVTITVVASTSGTTPGTVVNTATVASPTTDPNSGNNTDSETTTVLPPLPPQKGRIVVEKQTLPDGSSETFQFTGDAAGTLGDGQTVAFDVDAGTYTTTETQKSGWTLTSIRCDDADSSGSRGTATATFRVDEGETVKCVFTNTQDEVLPKPPIEPPLEHPSEKEEPNEPEQGDKVKGRVLPLTGGAMNGLISLAMLLLLSGTSLVSTARPRRREDPWRQP